MKSLKMRWVVPVMVLAICGAGAVWMRAGSAETSAEISVDEIEPTMGAADAADATVEKLEKSAPKAEEITAEEVTAPAADVKRGSSTGLPVPRYVSLKGSEGNARRGPSLSYRIDVVFRHTAMPLRITAEYGHWRRIEDLDGVGGWVHYSLISGSRTLLVQEDMLDLKSGPTISANVVARAEKGAILRLQECNDHWCRVTADGSKGWVPKKGVWGVDPDEIIE